MKQRLKSWLTFLLSKVGAVPTPMTDLAQVRQLLRQLAPVLTDKPLRRLGPKADGGYLVPDDLRGITACFSPGVNDVSGFEQDCAELGMQVFLADKSVERPPTDHSQFHFTQKYIGASSGGDFMTLQDWVRNSLPDHTADLLLQMDIEGYEYPVLLSLPESLQQRFRIIVVEFHQLDLLWSRPFFQLASACFEKLLKTHVCVHIHPNNCFPLSKLNGVEIPPLAEFTFLRKDRVQSSRPARQFPHPLDQDNTGNATVVLPQCWRA